MENKEKTDKRKSINLLMVEKGLAWSKKVRVHSVGSTKRMQEVQAEAKKQELGIWAAENPIPPWEWRKQKEEKKKAKAPDK